MLRALEPENNPPASAYRLPWRVDRVYDTHPLITNIGPAAVELVRVFINSRSGAAETTLWGQMLSGETAELCMCDHDADDVVVTLGWFRPETGVEYLWRFVP